MADHATKFSEAARAVADQKLPYRLADQIGRAFRGIGGNHASAVEFLHIGFDTYWGAGRGYHSLPHAGDMTLIPQASLNKFAQQAGLTPAEKTETTNILAIAGYGHDMAYMSVDRDLKPAINTIVGRSVWLLAVGAAFQATIKRPDKIPPEARIVSQVFGFEQSSTISEYPGQERRAGLNEYLSALVTAHHLAGGKTELDAQRQKHIAVAAAITEGTIPFRPNTTFEALYQNLRTLNLTDREATIAVKAAVMFANRDVGDFSGPLEREMPPLQRFQNFMRNGWWLIPETNQSLREEHYPPADYTSALRRRNMFMNMLKPENIFHSFRNYPPQEDMARYQAYTERNLRLSDQYHTAKIVSASIVEAIASVVDPEGQASLKTLMETVGQNLPPPINRNWSEDDAIVYQTLKNRGDKTGWDVSGSPIARYLMESVGKEGIQKIADAAQFHLSITGVGQKPEYRNFLREISSPEIGVIWDAMAASTKAQELPQDTPDENGARNRSRYFSRKSKVLAVA